VHRVITKLIRAKQIGERVLRYIISGGQTGADRDGRHVGCSASIANVSLDRFEKGAHDAEAVVHGALSQSARGQLVTEPYQVSSGQLGHGRVGQFVQAFGQAGASLSVLSQ